MLLCVGLGFQDSYGTVPAPFPQVSLKLIDRQSGCMNRLSSEIQSENKSGDLGKEEWIESVAVATLQLRL